MFSVTLVANAGLLIQCGKYRILLDAIEDAGPYPFSSTPKGILDEMISGDGESVFKNVDFLIFSHGHPDHFSPKLVQRYLTHNQIRRMVCAPAEDAAFLELMGWMGSEGIPVWKLKWERGKKHQYRLTKEICLTALCMKHMPHIFPKDLCSGLLLQYEGKQALFLTDCSFEEAEPLREFQGTPLDAVFLNPYFYYNEQGREILSRYQAKKTILYHIPFEGEDTIQLRPLAAQLVKKYPKEGFVCLKEPFQRLVV